MGVCYHGPHRKDDVSYTYCPDLEEMARRADCLIVTCPLTSATRGLITARVLSALGPGGFLVNVARGPVVDEQALIEALKERRIAGAALDVFWDEPRVPEALFPLENVVLMPPHGDSHPGSARGTRAKGAGEPAGSFFGTACSVSAEARSVTVPGRMGRLASCLLHQEGYLTAP